MRSNVIFDVVTVDGSSEQAVERRDTSVRNAARNDQIEVLQIGRDVEREPVARHPSRDPDADRRQLLASDPDAGQAVDTAGVDAVVGSGANQDLLDVADVSVDVLSIGFQIDNRITDDLSRAVVGDVAAATGFVHLDAARREKVGISEDVRSTAVAANAERQDVRVLDEQELVVNCSRLALVDERALQRQRLGVRDTPQATDDQTTFGSQFSSVRLTIDMY